MKIMKSILLLIVFFAVPIHAQDIHDDIQLSDAAREIINLVELNKVKTKAASAITTSQDGAIETSDERFGRVVLSTARQMVREGKMTRRDQLKLRVAMLSPSFRAHAEQLALIQIEFSGEVNESVPIGEDGHVQAGSINWEGLAAFLEKLLPLLLKLLEAFG